MVEKVWSVVGNQRPHRVNGGVQLEVTRDLLDTALSNSCSQRAMHGGAIPIGVVTKPDTGVSSQQLLSVNQAQGSQTQVL